MSKASVTVEFSFPDLLGAIENNRERIERTIAATIQTQVGLRFDAEGAYHGHDKWAPLKMRQGQILSLTGTLRKSMSPPGVEGNPGPQGFVTHQGSIVNLLTEVGTKLAYAEVHNQGAIIKPKSKEALRFLNPTTGKFIFAKQVTIPRRNFTDQNTQDTEEMQETLSNLVADIMDSA